MDLFDVEAIERVESELDRFVEKRAREVRDQENVEALWKESARRDLQRRREENRLAWLEHERHMERLHAGLCEEHRIRADELAGAQPMEGAAM